MKTVSILMAVYNGADFIEEAIRSVVEQSYPHWELLVVSNGSTDATVETATRAAGQDPRIRIDVLPAKGKNAAYNRAFELSRGDYLCFLAADDLLVRENLAERVAAIADAGDTAYATCCLQTFSDDPKYDGIVFPKDPTKPNHSGGSLLFTRALAERIFPLPTAQPNEDTWTMLHLRAFGTNRHVPRSLLRYRIHAQNSYGYQAGFAEKRRGYLARMKAYELFRDKHAHQDLPLLRDEVVPFLAGLRAAERRDVLGILRVRNLGLGSKAVLIFYCSELLYNIRHTYFKALSGGVAR